MSKSVPLKLQEELKSILPESGKPSLEEMMKYFEVLSASRTFTSDKTIPIFTPGMGGSGGSSGRTTIGPGTAGTSGSDAITMEEIVKVMEEVKREAMVEQEAIRRTQAKKKAETDKPSTEKSEPMPQPQIDEDKPAEGTQVGTW